MSVLLLVINSMEENPCWKTDTCLGGQEVRCYDES